MTLLSIIFFYWYNFLSHFFADFFSFYSDDLIIDRVVENIVFKEKITRL